MTGTGRWTPDTHTPRDFGDVPDENDYTYREDGQEHDSKDSDRTDGDRDDAGVSGDRER